MRALFAAALLASLAASAHEGESHTDAGPATALRSPGAERPQCMADGSLHVPKSVQRLLGIRTVVWPATPDHAAAAQSLLAEVTAQPVAALTLTAPEPGRLEPARHWPLPGETVAAGQVLAYLRPLLRARDLAQRRARLGDLDQKLVIAQINVDRLSLQAVGNDVTRVAGGNVRYEQVVAELEAVKRQRQLIAESLSDRIALRAAVSGRLANASAREGDVVAAGTPLFPLVDAKKLRLTAISYDPTLGARIGAAHATTAEGLNAVLAYRGQEPLDRRPGWRLLFDVADGNAAWAPGQLVDIAIGLRDAATATLPAAACVRDARAATMIWLHRGAETFVPVLTSCGSASSGTATALADGDRLVVNGAALLSQYR